MNRIINETDETITLEPGESVDVKLLKGTSKTTVAKLNRYKITKIIEKETNVVYVEKRHCSRCGVMNPPDEERCGSCGLDISDKEPVKLSR